MNQATALIAEDEPVLAEALSRQLHKLWPDLQVVGMASDGFQAREVALAQTPDILFLDIHMPGTNGLEVAEQVIDEWPVERPLPWMVYITAFDEYAVAAFERAAVDYVLKPVRPERLAITCLRLQALLSQRQGAANDDVVASNLLSLRTQVTPHQEPLRVLQAAVGASVYVIAIEDVIYFEAADKYVRIITSNRTAGQPEMLIRTPLRELMPRLDQSLFWQIHRGHVVNVRAVERISRQQQRLRVHLRGRTETLDVSRMYAHLFKAM
ncbi:MAG: response regulator transcription factor [Aquabacterium sp.]|uniref:LytR/AlgR family response regulator transcription factor n=1 Tax=Aquabacterium sp. TaxID=1872578 RepID=UPI0025B98BFA|nr:LytTR family DNA-binding domain-containing protein [Aquabacterium sp.]MBI5926254.1 response regulator transcription factor [Aquabacterium sp.]